MMKAFATKNGAIQIGIMIRFITGSETSSPAVGSVWQLDVTIQNTNGEENTIGVESLQNTFGYDGRVDKYQWFARLPAAVNAGKFNALTFDVSGQMETYNDKTKWKPKNIYPLGRGTSGKGLDSQTALTPEQIIQRLSGRRAPVQSAPDPFGDNSAF